METKCEGAVTDGIFSLDRNLISLPKAEEELVEALRSAVDYLRGRGAPSFKAHACATAAAEQKALEHMGFLPTGFLLGVRSNVGLSLRSDKRSLIVYARANSKKIAGPFFLPENMEFAEKLYRRLGVSTAVGTPGGPAELSQINTYHDEHNGVFYIRALECGKDLGKILQIVINASQNHPSKSITLMINTTDPTACYGYKTAREHGFWFSGFDPLNLGFEYMLMYYGQGVKLSLDELAATQTAKALLRDVMSIA